MPGYDPNCGLSTTQAGATVSASETPFRDLNDFVALPRVGALRLAPDGSWLAAAVQTLSPDKKKYLTSIWRIDAAGGPARRLTRSAEGEGSPRFLPDGSLLFTSRRPDPGRKKDSDGDAGGGAALWLLPAGGGEARMVAALPGGVTAAETARDAAAVVVGGPVLPAAAVGTGTGASAGDGAGGGPAGDAQLRQERKDAGITAILHESAPVRFWDHDLGPDQPRLFAVDLGPEDGVTGRAPEGQGDDQAERAASSSGLRDLTPEPGRALDGGAFELTPDGVSVLTGWWQWHPAGESHCELVTIDTASGKRRVLLSRPEFDFDNPRVSPDGRLIACLRERHATAERPVNVTAVLLDADGAGEPGDAGRDLLPGFDRWPGDLAWSHDSRALYFAADDGGRRPVFRADLETGEVTRVTSDDGAYTDLNPGPDGRYLYALRATVDSPPTPVRLDLVTGAEPAALDCPGTPVTVPGRLEEIQAAADDGQPVRSWLVLPETASAGQPGAAAALGARRPDEQLEHLVLAVEPVADGGPRLRRAAAGPGAVHRVRAGLHHPRPPGLGRPAVRRHHGGHRRRAGPPGHRRGPGRDDGRLLRRLHGELDGGPHRPLPGDREPRRAVDAGRRCSAPRTTRCSGGRSSVTR